MEKQTENLPLLIKAVMPEWAGELSALLIDSGNPKLGKQNSSLQVVDRCRCGVSNCSTIHTAPKPDGSYGAGHKNIVLDPKKGWIILDIVKCKIMCVEILHRPEIQKRLLQLLP
jgi:hypothetical protein